MKSRPSEHSVDVFVLLPEGRLDALAAPGLAEALTALEAQSLKQIIVDFSQSRYISSSCLRVMLTHTRRLRQAGGDLKFCCLPDKIAQVLRIAGLDALFDIFPSEEQAVQAFLTAPKSTDEPAQPHPTDITGF